MNQGGFEKAVAADVRRRITLSNPHPVPLPSDGRGRLRHTSLAFLAPGLRLVTSAAAGFLTLL